MKNRNHLMTYLAALLILGLHTLGKVASAEDPKISPDQVGDSKSISEGEVSKTSELKNSEKPQGLINSIEIKQSENEVWKTQNLTHSIGFNSLNEVIQYERWLDKKWGYLIFGSIKKEEDTLKTSTVTDENTLAFSKIETTSYTGSKSPLNFLIGGGVKNRLWQNPWLQINWGGLVMLHYIGEANSPIGSSKVVTPDTRSSSDYSVTETNLGEHKESSMLSLHLGPRVGAEVYLKWFPNVIIVADMQILMSLGAKQTITTNQSTQQYNVVSGVPQSPSLNSSSSTKETVNNGGTWATNTVGASNFGLTLFWGIKYAY